MKKIYRITVENTFYCVAEDENDAEEIIDEAKRDFFDYDNIMISEVKEKRFIPRAWLDGLTYGEEKDIKLKDWIARREEEEKQKKKQEELDALQLKLPLGVKVKDYSTSSLNSFEDLIGVPEDKK